MRQYDDYAIDKDDWTIIVDLLATDEGQYDDPKNPMGYLRRMEEQPFTLFVYGSGGLKNTITFGPDGMTINRKVV